MLFIQMDAACRLQVDQLENLTLSVNLFIRIKFSTEIKRMKNMIMKFSNHRA